MFEVLNDPWGLLALSLVLGSMITVVVYAFVEIIQHIAFVLADMKTKRGATKMSDREFRKYLREVNNDKIR